VKCLSSAIFASFCGVFGVWRGVLGFALLCVDDLKSERRGDSGIRNDAKMAKNFVFQLASRACGIWT
jgi:hypothetical protein